MRNSLLICTLLVFGCGHDQTESVDGAGGDLLSDGDSNGGNRDGGDDNGPAACVSFASLFDTCQLAFDTNLTLSASAIYDTTTNVLTVGGTEMPVAHKVVTIQGDEVDVISAQNIRIAAGNVLRGIGIRPLAIVASGTLTIEADARIDVSNGGAGAQMTCTSAATSGQNSVEGAAGGGGGGYGADGGRGSPGNGEGQPTIAGQKGLAVASVPTGLRGGCRGAAGGNGGASGGAGGPGGGALYVVAANRIELNSSMAINAGGGGGGGGLFDSQLGGNAGGGGGGSGGMLILEAPQIAGQNATIAANGGGGGEGSDDLNAGGSAESGAVTTSHALEGKDLATEGGDGGRGGSRETPIGEAATQAGNGGGGGGGGGVGFIRILSSDVQGVTTSPDPSPELP
jgi:hypothetical protein